MTTNGNGLSDVYMRAECFYELFNSFKWLDRLVAKNTTQKKKRIGIICTILHMYALRRMFSIFWEESNRWYGWKTDTGHPFNTLGYTSCCCWYLRSSTNHSCVIINEVRVWRIIKNNQIRNNLLTLKPSKVCMTFFFQSVKHSFKLY